MSDKSRDDRWSKQFGDFGEQLVLYVLGQQKNMKVAVVDHAGADLIASDLGNKNNRYAVSVKSHTLSLNYNNDEIKEESKGFNFNQKNVNLLRDFAENFDLQPVVSFVIVNQMIPLDHPIRKQEKLKGKLEKYNNTEIKIFTFLLDDVDKMIKEGKPYFSNNSKEGGFNFKFADSYFEELISDKRIDYTKLSFDVLNNCRNWDADNPMKIS